MLLTLGDLQCLLSAFIPIPGFLLPEPCKTLLPLSSGFDSPACFLSCCFFFSLKLFEFPFGCVCCEASLRRGNWRLGRTSKQEPEFQSVHLIDKGGFDGRDSPDASLSVAVRSCSCL